MEKKYLSIKQWAGKADKLRTIFNIEPSMVAAEIKYNYFSHSNIREVVYVLYFSHLKDKTHSNGTDWREVYKEMFEKLSEHRANELITVLI